ncbi:hypothetical protein KR032_004895 [Drosophila birchii]|nr:hypothetical protein KR032_004895 [Drosophila birchii]
MSAPDDIPSMSPARNRKKSSESSESQPSTTPPVEPRPSTSNGHESGHSRGGHGHGHGHGHSHTHSSGHHSRRPSTGRSSTDSRSSASGGRSSSHGDNVRRLSSMRDRVLVSNANAMARGMSFSELDDTTTTATATTSSSSSPQMNGHDQNNTNNDQAQKTGMSNGARKKKKKKRNWHRSLYDRNLIGWTGQYPNFSTTADPVLESSPGLEGRTSDELRALSRRGLMVYPREAQGSEAAAAAAAEPQSHQQQQQQQQNSLATYPSPMSSPIGSSLSPNSELNRNLTPGPETGQVPEFEQPPITTTTTSTNLTTTRTASNSPTCEATATAAIAAGTPPEKSVKDDAKEQQSEEKQQEQVADSSTSRISGKRQGSPLEIRIKEEESDKKSAKEEPQLTPPMSKRQKNEETSPSVCSRSRSKSLNVQELTPKLEQATNRSKSQESLIVGLSDLPSPETEAKEKPSPSPEPYINVKSDLTPSPSMAKSVTPSPNAVKPELSSPRVAKPESPVSSVAEPVALSSSVVEPLTSSSSVVEPVASSSSVVEPVASSSSVAEPSLSLAEPEPGSQSEVKPKLLSNNSTSSTTKLKATDKFYRLPFEYGWRRELVLPSLGNPKRRTGDVFFISPSGRKLRSREDIIPLLEGDLTIQNFCFQRVPQDAGPEHELVRRATPSVYRSKQNEAAGQLNQPQEPAVTGKRVSKPKVPKGASPPSEGWTATAAVKGKVRSVLSSSSSNGGNQSAGASVSRKQSKMPKMSSSDALTIRPEKERGPEMSSEAPLENQLPQLRVHLMKAQPPAVGTPMDTYEISDGSDEDNDDTGSSSAGSAMEIAEEVELRGQQPPAVEQQQQEPDHRPFRDMDVVVIGGRKAIVVRAPLPRPPVKLVPRPPDLTSYDRIYRKRIQDKRLAQTLAISLDDAHIGVNLLAAVMKTMNMQERVTMSQVCTTWAMVSRDNRVWNKVILRDTHVKNWIKLLMEMTRHRTRELDMMGVIMDTPKLRFAGELRVLKTLRVLRTDATTNEFLKLVLSSLPQLQELRTTCVSSHLHLGRLERMRKLRVLRINMVHPKAQALHLNAVGTLSHLTELSIRGVSDLKPLDLTHLKNLTRLQVLGLGSCEYLNHEQLGRDVLPCLKALHTLRIENDHRAMAMFPVDEILHGVALAGGVQRLELINVDVDSGFGQLLASCSTVTHLLLAPKCLHNTATMTNAVMQAIRDNADHLVIFRLVLVTQLLSATENLYKGTQKNVIPVQRPVPGIPSGDALNNCSPEDNCQEEEHTQCVAFLPVDRLEAILNEMMPMGCLSVAKVAMSETTNMQFLEPGVGETT